MTQLSFRYSMRIDFDSPVSNHSFLLRCLPQSDGRQSITDMELSLCPQEDIWQEKDGFGNLYVSGSVRSLHDRFEVVVTGKALMEELGYISSENELRENIFKYKTRLTAPGRAILDALDRITKGISEDELETSEAVMNDLAEHMNYVPGATFVETTAEEAFEKGQGVCQDYAHIMLAMLRAKGICSRYVVGMMEGEGFSHAWVEVRHNGKWYGFDPTNHTRVSDKYIKISHGRDYSDCMINVGCMTGYAMQTTYISVSVREHEE